MNGNDITRSLLLNPEAELELRLRRARLQVESGPSEGTEVVLGDRPWVIGRGEDADLRLADPAASRTHARLEPEGEGGWRLVDLGSKSGTWLGGARIEAATLVANARFRIGGSDLVLCLDQVRLATEPCDEFHGLVSRSEPMRRLFGMLARLAPLELPLLLLGEPGTGKEGLAHAVHALSPRRDGPYQVVDCTLLAGDHLRSELFGHVKGAFTGATSDRPGAFELADGGTLLLDEVGEIPLELQPTLLRALEQGEVRPLGGTRARRVRVRVLAATNRDLATMVEAGSFRRDLFDRLGALEVRVPPLRERGDDVLFLAEHFLPEGVELTEAARAALLRHDWAGNVRQLKHAAARGAALAEGGAVTPEDLGLEAPAAAGAARGGAPQDDVMTIEEWTEKAIRRSLETHDGNRRAVAAELGIGRTTLYRHMKKLGLL